MTIEYGIDELRSLIGPEHIPKHGIPAAWWVTTDVGQIGAYDRWKADYTAHIEKVDTLARTIGVTSADAFLSSWGGRSVLTGFRAPLGMRLWHGHEEHTPVPSGWRVDKKTDRLVPSRKTKADRESRANKDFAAIKTVPDVQAYVSGLPMEIYLDDRAFGGTVYKINYRRGNACVWAYCGGDPDRASDSRRNGHIDSEIWHRQKLSRFVALQEVAA